MQSGIFETWLSPERFEQVRRWQRKEKHYGVLFFFFLSKFWVRKKHVSLSEEALTLERRIAQTWEMLAGR